MNTDQFFWGAILLTAALLALPGWVTVLLVSIPAVIGLVVWAAYSYCKMLNRHKNENLITQNNHRLAAWQAAGHVSPDVIAQSVLIPLNPKGDYCGTAFLIEGGIVVTNRHVKKAMQYSGTFVTQQGIRVHSALSYIPPEDSSPDLAFHKLHSIPDTLKPLPLAEHSPVRDELFLVVGNHQYRPRFHASVVALVNHWRPRFGYVSGKAMPTHLLTRILAPWAHRRLRKTGRVLDKGAANAASYATAGDLYCGNSGSPMVTPEGKVVGVHYAGRALALYADEVYGFAVTLDDLKAHLAIAKDMLK